jgi:Tetratricopeptide repeat
MLSLGEFRAELPPCEDGIVDLAPCLYRPSPAGTASGTAAPRLGRSAGPAVLTVLTWKVQDLFRREQPADAAAQVIYRRKVMSLAATICDSGAEIVALQEIASLNALDDLLAELGGDWQHRASDPDERGTRTVWLARSRQAEDSVGECRQARKLTEDTLSRCRSILGDDHPDTLRFASDLAFNLRASGQLEKARELDEDTLDRRRNILGDDHPDTLISANNLAVDLTQLGKHQQARVLGEDTLRRRRRVLGDDDLYTLDSASNLAADLTELGQHQQARELGEDTLARRRHILGDDHPDTLTSASKLAMSLHALGELERARDLNEDTLRRRRHVLGDEHPATRRSVRILAADLTALGEVQRAATLLAEFEIDP